LGDSIGVDIVISGMESDKLAEFDFNINYDDTILAFDSYSLGTELGVIDPSDPLAVAEDWSWGDLGGGVINLAEFSYLSDFSSQPDAFTLSTVYFTGSNLGTSLLTFSDAILGDEWGDSLSAGLESGSISPVPEPATILLLDSGMAGLRVFGRKKFKRGEINS